MELDFAAAAAKRQHEDDKTTAAARRSIGWGSEGGQREIPVRGAGRAGRLVVDGSWRCDCVVEIKLLMIWFWLASPAEVQLHAHHDFWLQTTQ